jgi:hypothetical protein
MGARYEFLHVCSSLLMPLGEPLAASTQMIDPIRLLELLG